MNENKKYYETHIACLFSDKYNFVIANKENGTVNIIPTPKNNNPSKLINTRHKINCTNIFILFAVIVKLRLNAWKTPHSSSTI